MLLEGTRNTPDPSGRAQRFSCYRFAMLGVILVAHVGEEALVFCGHRGDRLGTCSQSRADAAVRAAR
jgi:hypothetical protein